MESKITVGAPSTLDLLEKVVKEEIKALVVRVNSPGGTVATSQELYKSLRRLSDKHNVKVVVSMGDLSASGGVYVAMAGDYILAHPGTVTGSIGVLIRSGNFQALLDKLGIRSDVIKSGKYKDILSFDRSVTEEERKLLQDITDDTYDQFIHLVADRRHLPVEKVKTFADGRIFSGRQALDYGLVDALGDLHDAVEKARELAGLTLEVPPRLVKLKKPVPAWKHLLKGSVFDAAQPLGGIFADHESLRGVPLWLTPVKG